jgi:hypothetical protein
MTYKTLTKKILAASFGTTEEDLTPACLEIFESMKKRYSVVGGLDREKLIVTVLKRIEDDKQVIGAPERTDKWYKGWKENLDEFRESEHDLKALMPKFIRKNQPIRFMGEYILPEEEHFEHVYFNIYRTWLFERTFSEYDSFYDIGCGSSYNLIKLCSMFPDKKVYGFDFVQSSVDIVGDLVEKHSFNAQGGLFNMIEPDFNIELDNNSLIFTSGAIEQIASKYEKFVEFLLEKKPQLVVHVEPTYEVYNQDILFDYLAAKFHKKRGYTMGYLPRLRQLESEGKIKILNVKRLNFGSLFFEGFTNIIWKPL